MEILIIDIKKKDPNMKVGEILEKCKEKLVAIATPDGIARIERSTLDVEEIQHWKNVYFQAQHFQYLLRDQTVKVKKDSHMVIINKLSNINIDVISCLEEITTCCVLKLSTFQTESQFQKHVIRFWFELDHEFLVFLHTYREKREAANITSFNFMWMESNYNRIINNQKRPLSDY